MAKQHIETEETGDFFNLENILSKPVANSPIVPVMDAEDTSYTEMDSPPDEPEPQYIEGESERGPGFMHPQDIAETIVGLIDGLQSSVVPYLREKKVFSGKELEILDKVDKSGKTVYSENSPEAAVLKKWLRHADLIKQIPFDEAEKRRLVNATNRYAETTNMQVTPFTGLLMAYSEVALKRSAMFFQD